MNIFENPNFIPNQNEALQQDKESHEVQNPAMEKVFNDVSVLLKNASDTDLVYGTIKGRLKTVPSQYFEISFDSDKSHVVDVIRDMCIEKIPTDVVVESLNREIFIANQDQKDIPLEQRNITSGGYTAII
jgi:ferredoxin-fold anticodon binding domain-containing protein